MSVSVSSYESASQRVAGEARRDEKHPSGRGCRGCSAWLQYHWSCCFIHRRVVGFHPSNQPKDEEISRCCLQSPSFLENSVLAEPYTQQLTFLRPRLQYLSPTSSIFSWVSNRWLRFEDPPKLYPRQVSLKTFFLLMFPSRQTLDIILINTYINEHELVGQLEIPWPAGCANPSVSSVSVLYAAGTSILLPAFSGLRPNHASF